MEKYGITVEKYALKEYGGQLVGRIEELEKNIYEQAGKTFNINSPKQLGVILFEDLKMPFAKKTKTGYSTRRTCRIHSGRWKDSQYFSSESNGNGKIIKF